MKRALLGAHVLLIAAAGIVHAADDYPILVYPCYETDSAPVLDGQLNDVCWARAPLVGGFTYHNKHEKVDVQTFWRAVADQTALYVAVQCDEPLAKKLSKGLPSRKDEHAAVFFQEALELFIDPKHDHANYYQIAFSISGTVYDSKATDTSWNSDTRTATAVGDNGWTAEVSVPWADLGLKEPKAGTVVGFNLCRDRNIIDNKQWTCWSQIEGNFHDPMRFGHLVLSATPEILGSLSQEFRLGERRGALHVFGPEGFSRTSYLALAKDSLKQLDAALADLEALRKKEAPGTVVDAIGKRIASASEAVMPFRQKIESGAPLDAAEWLHADTQIQKTVEELRNYVWQARLEALLASI